MSRKAAIITQADVARAIRAAKQCGAGAVEIKPDGTILVLLSPPIAVTTVQNQEPVTKPKAKVVL